MEGEIDSVRFVHEKGFLTWKVHEGSKRLFLDGERPSIGTGFQSLFSIYDGDVLMKWSCIDSQYFAQAARSGCSYDAIHLWNFLRCHDKENRGLQHICY